MDSEDALEELAIREEYRDAFREEMSEIGQSFVVFMIGKVRTVVGDRKKDLFGHLEWENDSVHGSLALMVNEAEMAGST